MLLRLSLSALILAGIGQATVISESGDAGDSRSTAQVIATISAGDSIHGTISSESDADVFKLTLPAGSFGATTVTNPGTLPDTILFLFDSTGALVTLNDDSAGGTLSTISANLTAGTYYLGVSAFDKFPLNINSLDAGWDDRGFYSGTYTITLRGDISASSVPEPDTMLLSIAGLASIAFARRFSRRQ
jgi:hypothetical protein